MVLRQFAAFDNEAFVVDSSSPTLTSGSPIINNSSTPVGTVFEFTDDPTTFPYQSIVLDDTSGSPDIFEDNQPGGHEIVEGRGLVDPGTNVESESYHYVRLLDDDGEPVGPRITINVFSKDGDFEDVWGMAADAQLVPGGKYVKVGGSNNGDSEYEDFVPCFTDRARILTREGLVPITSLGVGDSVATRDNGFQQIAWIGKKVMTAADQLARPHLSPVRIRTGALGPMQPDAETLLSPNHRVLVSGAGIEVSFGAPELFVAAKHLVGLPGIEVAAPAPLTYIHLLFEHHEVVLADGVWSESFQPGDVALNGMDPSQTEELFELFPDLAETDSQRYQSARPIIGRREAELARLSFPG